MSVFGLEYEPAANATRGDAAIKATASTRRQAASTATRETAGRIASAVGVDGRMASPIQADGRMASREAFAFIRMGRRQAVRRASFLFLTAVLLASFPVHGIIANRTYYKWRSDREAEGARLLSEYAPKGHLGFESLLLRHDLHSPRNRGGFFSPNCRGFSTRVSKRERGPERHHTGHRRRVGERTGYFLNFHHLKPEAFSGFLR